jgi:hypothetical protein
MNISLASGIRPIAIKIGGKEVLATGTIIADQKKLIEFSLANLRFVMRFEHSDGSQRLEIGESTETSIELKLINFDNPLGSGTTVPVLIGNLSGRELYLAFMVYALDEKSIKTVHFTFSLGDTVSE